MDCVLRQSENFRRRDIRLAASHRNFAAISLITAPPCPAAGGDKHRLAPDIPRFIAFDTLSARTRVLTPVVVYNPAVAEYQRARKGSCHAPVRPSGLTLADGWFSIHHIVDVVE